MKIGSGVCSVWILLPFEASPSPCRWASTELASVPMACGQFVGVHMLRSKKGRPRPPERHYACRCRRMTAIQHARHLKRHEGVQNCFFAAISRSKHHHGNSTKPHPAEDGALTSAVAFRTDTQYGTCRLWREDGKYVPREAAWGCMSKQAWHPL